MYFQLNPFLSFDKLWDFEFKEVFKVWHFVLLNKWKMLGFVAL